jgi:SpoVK/Ycf46/Vps4 family AAA+-type ATPase
MTEGMTGADIAAIVNAAAMAAIREHVIKQKKEGEKKLKLSMRNFEAALNKIKTRRGVESNNNNSSGSGSTKTIYPMSFPGSSSS